MKTAQRHAVVPLLYRALERLPPGMVSAQIVDDARQQFERNALRNMTLTACLVELVETLEADGLAVMPIKGPLLALSAYGDITLRSFLDLDVVVHYADRGRALSALRRAGYRSMLPLTPGAEAALLASDYHLQLMHDVNGVLVELHWALGRGTFGGSMDGSWPWRNACTESVLGRDMHTLSREALLVYLCAHGAKHTWSQLSWICDVAALLGPAPSLDGGKLFMLARSTGAWRMVQLGIVLAHELLCIEVPSGLPARCDDDVVSALAEPVMEQLFDPSARMNDRRMLVFQLAVRDGWRDRMGLWAHLLLSPRVADVTFVSLPPALRSLYYVLRPLRLLSKHGKAWVGAGGARWRG